MKVLKDIQDELKRFLSGRTIDSTNSLYYC